ncbi:MAG: sulfatase-like hydrolase/transferase [Cyclobacteriaceae bacterium]
MKQSTENRVEKFYRSKAFLWAVLIALFPLKLEAQQPNVLIFMVDDLRDELGCYGSEFVKSPNIDKLADEGVKFNKAYAQQAICAPSRMSILTGLRPESLGIFDIFTRLDQTHPDIMTMPRLYKENGYKTVSIGKVFHHGNDFKSQWSTYIGKEGNAWAEPGNTELKSSHDAGAVADEFYKDGRVARDAISELNKLRNDKFLMVVGFSKPHLPFNAPKKYWDLYDREDIQIPQQARPTNMPSWSLSNWGELRGYGDIPPEGNLDEAKTKELIHGYYACVSYVDAQVGKVMQRLEELDLRKNTMVIFMSDHGFKIGEYSAWCKHSVVEIDSKVPLIISRETGYHSRKSGVESDEMVENIDVFPTIIHASRLTPPNMDGKSLLGLVTETETDYVWEDSVSYGLYAQGQFRMGLTVTDGKWRYSEWRLFETQEIKGRELYLHDQSQVAKENLAGKSEYSGIQDTLKQLLDLRFPEGGPSFKIVPTVGDNSGTPGTLFPDLDVVLSSNPQQHQIADLKVYPNPSESGVFYLSHEQEWEVISIAGKQVLSGMGNMVDLSGSQKGVYLLRTSEGAQRLVF